MMSRKQLMRVVWVALGATGGYAYYHFIGYASGTCPISSNPYVSTAYGALIAVVATWDSSGKPRKA
jgi:hypothetical protein